MLRRLVGAGVAPHLVRRRARARGRRSRPPALPYTEPGHDSDDDGGADGDADTYAGPRAARQGTRGAAAVREREVRRTDERRGRGREALRSADESHAAAPAAIGLGTRDLRGCAAERDLGYDGRDGRRRRRDHVLDAPRTRRALEPERAALPAERGRAGEGRRAALARAACREARVRRPGRHVYGAPAALRPGRGGGGEGDDRGRGSVTEDLVGIAQGARTRHAERAALRHPLRV